MARLMSVFLLPLLGAGCAGFLVSEDNWGKTYARYYCDYMKSCEKYLFYDDYDNEADCIDDLSDDWEDSESKYYQDCDFSKAQAHACLSGLSMSCKKIADDWQEVWDDCNSVWDCY